MITAHQNTRCLTISPTEQKTKTSLPDELVDPLCSPTWILCSQANEFYLAAQILFPNLFIVGNFHPARTAPRRPNIYDKDLALEIRKAKAVVVKSSYRTLSKTFW